MNKFITVVLFACVASALAGPIEINDEASELALFETDEKETAGLTGDKQIFADFCIQARDDVKVQLKDGINSGTARIFNLVVDTMAQVSSAVGDAQRDAAAQGAEAVGNDAKEFKNAVAQVMKAMAGTGSEKITQIFVNLKEQLNKEKLQETAEDACAYISGSLKPGLDKKLNAYKSSIAKTPEGEKFADMIKTVKVDNLGCVTTSRISKVASACRMVSVLGPTVMEFLGH